VSLRELDEDHQAVAYLRHRGFDPAELSERWQVGYCLSSRFLPMSERLYIPIHQGGKLVFWQGRTLVEGLKMKYFNTPGLHKSSYLYNFDRARKQPGVVVVEGVTDAWRVGPSAVAFFGKKASREQITRLIICSHGKPLLVALDGEAGSETDILVGELRRLRSGSLVVVRLPADKDPGSLAREELWHIFRAAARNQNVDLPSSFLESAFASGPTSASLEPVLSE
jgi:DNA primase